MRQWVSFLLLGAATSSWSQTDLSIDGYQWSDATELEVMSSDFMVEDADFSMPVVLTATRLKQQQSEVPASVTILDAELIRKLGVKNLADLLRHVPGMMIGPDRNNNADSVHYHGGPAALPKNLQVLINGRSMYRSGLAAVSWYELPVAVEDISRIEVVRGPNSASYGANAYQAVINILTKHPSDTKGAQVLTQFGNNGDHYLYLKDGGHAARHDYRISYVSKSTDHFKDVQNPIIGCADPCPDGRRSQFVNLEAFRQMDSMGEIEWSAVWQDSKKTIGNPADYQVNENQLTESRYELGMRLTKDFSAQHQLKVNAYGTRFKSRQPVDIEGVYVFLLDDDLRALYQLNPAAANELASGEQPVSLNTSDATEVQLATSFSQRYQDMGLALTEVSGQILAELEEYRFDVEVQDTFVVSDEVSLVMGASLRHDEVTSKHYFNGTLENDTYRAFGSATYTPWDDWYFHLGMMAEKETDMDTVYAPRAAVNYKFVPNQSLRFVYSESVRSPDIFEQHANWNFEVLNPSPSDVLNGTTFYQVAKGPGSLDHQTIKSHELGWFGRARLWDAEWDVKIFQEQLADVVYQSIKLSEFSTSTDNTICFQGIEWQAQGSPWEGGQLRLIGSHVEADYDLASDVDISVLLRVYAKDVYASSWIQDWGSDWSSTFSWLVATKFDQTLDNPEGRSELNRLDGQISKGLRLGAFDTRLSLTFQHDVTSDPYIQVNNQYEKETRAQLAASVSF